MAKNNKKARMRICERCKKREMTTSKSELCRRCFIYEYAKNKRHERVKNGFCACCGKKVKPKIIITYRCESCNKKIHSKKQNKLQHRKQDDKYFRRLK